MARPRPFRFGVQVSDAGSASAWTDLARKAEDLGFSTLSMPDHFSPQLAPVPALMAAADATTSLRVGALVFDNDYKHPVVLAKELATLDLLSGGRIEIGLGAGWMETDYLQAGIPYDPPATRVDRFEEGVAVIKGLFAGGAFTFEGDHYSVTALDGTPKPIQQPHPPLLIGGGGRRMLSIAAREADIVGVNPSLRAGKIDLSTAADATAARFDEKIALLRTEAGARFADIELSCLMFFVALTDDAPGFAANMAPMFGLDAADVMDVPVALFGTVDGMCEQLEARRERWGFSYFCVQADAMDTIAPVVDRLAGS